ncbi:MAG: hypothetical protein KAY29_01325 [Brevundimonas sp.]|nr:hypothetical protein [Brevundimonas sp.]
MKTTDLIAKFREAGFTARCNWYAKKTDEKAVSVSEWFIYHDAHGLLTSCIVNEFDGGGLAVYWCNEKNDADSDVVHLRAIIAQREAVEA